MAAVLTRREKWSIKVLTALVLMACYHNSLSVRSYLLWAALVPPFLSGDSSSFLLVTGLMREAFDSMVYIVIPPGHTMRRRRRGRPCSLLPDGMLGLILCFLGSQMTIKWLCLIFGITSTPCSHILKKNRHMTVKRLHFHPLARLKFPDEQKMKQFAEMISIREPTILSVIGFMDRLGLAI